MFVLTIWDRGNLYIFLCLPVPMTLSHSETFGCGMPSTPTIFIVHTDTIECKIKDLSTKQSMIVDLLFKDTVGISNPVFSTVLLCELNLEHIFNKYQICDFHNIRCCVILSGHQVCVFTPIYNYDIQTYIKALFLIKKLWEDMTGSKAYNVLIHYTRYNSSKYTIPCINSIQKYLYHLLGITWKDICQ